MTPTNKPVAAEEEGYVLGPFGKGINNRADQTKLDKDELRKATNVDITTDGQPQTRTGYVKRYSGSGMRCPWHDPALDYALCVEANTLKAFDRALVPVTLVPGLRPAAPLSYCEINDEAYWSNRYQCGKITPELTPVPWAIENPGTSPDIAVVAGGSLPAGRYQVAATFLIPNPYISGGYEEGGASLATEIDLPHNSAIACSNVPQPLDPRVVLVRLYCGGPGGAPNDGDRAQATLRFAIDLPVGMTNATINTGSFANTRALETQWLIPMPAGQIVRYLNGRLWVASGNAIYHSEPMRPGLMHPENFTQYGKGGVKLMEPCGEADQGGMFVCASERTFYISSADPKKPKRVTAHPHGAVQGTGRSVPGWLFDKALDFPCAFWMDDVGNCCLGLPGGRVRILSDVYVAPQAESGSSLIRDIDGIRQIIVSMRGASGSQARAFDSVIATVNKNGVNV